jgi:hypothetical protein
VKHYSTSLKLCLKSANIKAVKIVRHSRRNARRLTRYGAAGNNAHYIPHSFADRGASAREDKGFHSA